MHPGTDTGYGDLKRRVDGTFVAATYYASRDSTVADVEQYTFGGERARLMIETDRDGDGAPDANSAWREVYHGRKVHVLHTPAAMRWRVRLLFSSTDSSGSPKIRRMKITPR
jgi:hypothetical protein